jgi:hypothetical protein
MQPMLKRVVLEIANQQIEGSMESIRDLGLMPVNNELNFLARRFEINT